MFPVSSEALIAGIILGCPSDSEGHWDLSSLYIDPESGTNSFGTRLKNVHNLVARAFLKAQLYDLFFDGRNFTPRNYLSIRFKNRSVDILAAVCIKPTRRRGPAARPESGDAVRIEEQDWDSI